MFTPIESQIPVKKVCWIYEMSQSWIQMNNKVNIFLFKAKETRFRQVISGEDSGHSKGSLVILWTAFEIILKFVLCSRWTSSKTTWRARRNKSKWWSERKVSLRVFKFESINLIWLLLFSRNLLIIFSRAHKYHTSSNNEPLINARKVDHVLDEK